jgi:hypothetical protein
MAFVRDGLVNGARAFGAQAKWTAGRLAGSKDEPAPPPYTGGPDYPSKGQ